MLVSFGLSNLNYVSFWFGLLDEWFISKWRSFCFIYLRLLPLAIFTRLIRFLTKCPFLRLLNQRLDQSVWFVRIKYQPIIFSLKSAKMDGKTKDIFEQISRWLFYFYFFFAFSHARWDLFSCSFLNCTNPTRATLLIALPFYRLTVISLSFFLILVVYNIGAFIISLVYMVPENIKCWKAYRESFEAVHCNRKRWSSFYDPGT